MAQILEPVFDDACNYCKSYAILSVVLRCVVIWYRRSSSRRVEKKCKNNPISVREKKNTENYSLHSKLRSVRADGRENCEEYNLFIMKS